MLQEKKRKKDYILISSKTLYVQWSIIHVNDVYFTFSGLKCNFTESTESNIPAKMLNSGGCGAWLSYEIYAPVSAVIYIN